MDLQLAEIWSLYKEMTLISVFLCHVGMCCYAVLTD